MGALFAATVGAGVLMVDSSLAQSTVNGTWNVNGGSWGALTNWSYSQPMRPAAITVTLNPGPLVTAVRKGDRLDAIELQNVVGSGGSGFTKTPSVLVSDPGVNGRPAIVRANLDIDDGVQPGDVGAITSFTVLDGGAGYTGTPTVTVTREIAGLVVTDPGSGYSKAPLLEFSGGGGYASNTPPTVTFRGGLGGGAQATAVVANNGSVPGTSGTIPNNGTGIIMDSMGEGYSSLKPPTASFVTTTGGTGATLTPLLGVSAKSFTINSGTTTYSVAPDVVISGGLIDGKPSGATATAVLDGSGKVVGVTITSPGAPQPSPDTDLGFTSAPSIAFTGGTVLSAGVNPTGVGNDKNFVIRTLRVNASGSGYSTVPANAPSIVISRPAPDNLATGTAIVEDGRVIAVEINDGGIGYTFPPQVIFSAGGAVLNGGVFGTATIADGEVQAVDISAAHAAVPVGGGAGGALASTNFSADPAVAKFGAIASITLSNSGQGYTAVPTVAIGATLRRTATATSSITGSTVTSVNLGNPGSGYIVTPAVSFSTARWLGYTSAPRVRFVSNGVTGAIATATKNAANVITGLTIVDGGAAYPVAPTVKIAGGNGTGATATATVSATGLLTAVNMTNKGSSYKAVPTVIFTGGGGTGATATANVSGERVNSITITNPGSGFTSAPTVTILSADVADPALATATLTAGRVTGLSVTHGGSGYTGTPIVVFTSGGVTFATGTASISAGRLSQVALTYPGSGYSTAPTLVFTGGQITGGTQGSAAPTVSGGRVNDTIPITSPGGAIPATATAIMNPNGTVAGFNLTNGGTGYLSAPPVTIAGPTGVDTPVMLAPGGVGSFVQFNRDAGNSTITLDDARVVGSMAIGDTGGEDLVFNSGTGGVDSFLSFSMGAIGGGKSFLTKIQGDQDVINAPILLTDELNVRINAGRLTLAGGITGTGSMVLSGNSVLTVRGVAPTSNLVDLWLWNRGTGSTGAQVELGVQGGPGFGNIRLGNVSAGTGGHAVLQLLENRGSGLADPTPFLDQINDNARIVVDGVNGRWGYFKLMGGDETIGSILDVSNGLVLENMEGEAVNNDAVLTLGGDNLDSYIGGHARNRGSGSGSGTLGITKNGTGTLTLAGGSIIYTGDTLLNAGTLRLLNTSNFNSRIESVSGTTIEVETTTGINFDNDVVGDSDFLKLGASSLAFNSGQLKLEDFFMSAGTTTFRSGASTLRGGENIIEGSFIIKGDGGLNKTVRIADSLSVGNVQAEGRFGQTGSFFDVVGERLAVGGRAFIRDGVLESSGAIEITNMLMRLNPVEVVDNKVVSGNAAAATASTTLILNDVNNVVIGAVLTFGANEAPSSTKVIPGDTFVTAVNFVTRAVTLTKAVRLPSGTNVRFTYSSQTDGAVRGESLNFADVAYDGRRFLAVTQKGTIHHSVNGTTWTQVYEDPLGQPLESLSWTGERYVAVGTLGRVVTSGAGNNWVAQSSGIATTLRGVTGTEVPLNGNTVSGSAVITNVTGGLSFLPGMTIVGNATAPDTRIVSATVTGATVSVLMDGAALAAGTEVEFGYFKGTTVTTGTAPAALTVTNVRTAQHVPTGIILTTSASNGIPAGTTVLSTNGPQSRITLSANANGGAPTTPVDLFTLTGNTSGGTDTITNLSNTSGLAVGMTIKGSGLPAGTRITAINTATATLTVNVKLPTTLAAVPLSVFTGRLVANSAIVEDVTSANSFNAGMSARGRFVPAGTKVLSSTDVTITLTNPAVGTTSSTTGTNPPNIALLAAKTVMTRTGNFASNDPVITGVSDITGLVQGMPISAPGVIPAGTVIQAVAAGTITMSQPALAAPVGQTFNTGFDLVTVGDDGRILVSAGGATDTWVSMPSGITRDLNSITWNGTRFVAVGDHSEVLSSTTGLTWTRQTPPLAASENVIISSTAPTTIGLNNPAVPPAAAAGTSFAAFKGDVSASASITNLTGIHILRKGLQISTPTGFQSGAALAQVTPTVLLNSPATATINGAPIQTFTALTNTRVIALTGVTISAATDLVTKVGHGLQTGDSITLTTIAAGAGLKPGSVYFAIRVSDNTFKLAISPADAEFGNAVNVTVNRTGVVITPNPNVIREVTDFKGLMVGMLLHGSALSGQVAITGMDPVKRTITLASAPTSSGRFGFGVLFGDIVNGSSTISNIRIFPSIQTLSGRTAHFNTPANRPVAAFPDRIGEGVTVSSFSSGANTITLSAPAIGTGYVPLYTMTGVTTNGSNLITDVPTASMGGVAAGQLIYVTGTAEATDTFSVFTITAVNSAEGEITLSAPPSLNLDGTPVLASFGVFTGLVTSGDNVVRNLSNRLGVPPPVLAQPDLQDVTWTGSQFITVGGYGAVLTSPDGVAWTPRNAGTGHDLYAVGLSGAQILAAGEDGLIMRSTNGIAWTEARAADDPAILDVRLVRDIQAIVGTTGRTLALGSGGTASADGTTWDNSVNTTFSGTQTFLTIGGRLGGGGGLQIRNDYITTTGSQTSNAGGLLSDTNNPNRIDDGLTLQSKGGVFTFENTGTNDVFSETIGKLLLDQGQFQIQAYRAGLTGTSTLTFGSLEAKPGATLDFLSRAESGGTVSTVLGAIGENARNRVILTQAPVLDDGIIGGHVTIDNEFATYDPINGITRLLVSEYETGDQPGWTSSDNVRMAAGRTLTNPAGSVAATMVARAINSLVMVGQTLNLDSKRLSIESGGLLVTGTAVIQGTSGNLVAGSITRGTAKDADAVLNIINPSQLTLNTQIVDFNTSAITPNNFTSPIGTSVIRLPAAALVGLVVGMEVSGGGAAIPAGARIQSINAGTSEITLSVPLAAALPPSTSVSFSGGSVSLAKSGVGLLILGGSNTYTGKTYLNNGTIRFANIEALGTAPAAFVPDQIQINGGTLQLTHVPTNDPIAPPHQVFLNDGLRGLTVGIAGGRIEVGVSNPDKEGVSGTKAPEIDLTITNPINAIGMLELAVRANSGLGQRNSVTLGSVGSANIYRAGIKTEAGFDGLMIIRGNNQIGGIFSEGGTLILDGDNDFTSPIRSATGDITITGHNTWKGTEFWSEPLTFSSGKLLLNTADALGTGGLNLAMGEAAELALAGISQTLRSFTSTPGSVITNNNAPNGFLGATPVVFDLDRSQTYAGLIKDGLTVNNTGLARLRLVKQGPGTLTLTNATTNFSGGVQILEGAINVTTISNIFSPSALGQVSVDDPALLVIDKSTLSITPANAQRTDRSFTMGSGPYGATLSANGPVQEASVTLGIELRDAITGTTQISTPIAFLGTEARTLTLSGIGRGDNKFLLELGDASASGLSGLLKTSSGTWVLGKSNPYSGLTTVQEGNLVVTRNDALGTKGRAAIVNQGAGTFTGSESLPNGTPVTFPLFATTTLPGGVKADTQYYVVGSSGNSFQIATTPGGAPIALTTAGNNVQFVPKIDTTRSTTLTVGTGTFTGYAPNGSVVTLGTKIISSGTVVLPVGLLTNTPYYVVNSDNGTFQISDTPGGAPLAFTGTSTPDSLYYSTNAVGNAAAGVNLNGGTLELRDVDYITPEQLIFEGGALSVPIGKRASWSGDLLVNANSRITVGSGGTLTLNGNILGSRALNQEGEGTVIMRGETLAAATNVANGVREYAVRAGTLLLDYSLNSGSKLVDNALLRVGGSRRGGTVILSGENASHEEIISQLVLEPGVSKIYRENGTSTIRLNNINRSTGGSLYVDGGRIAKADNVNFNGIMGAWAIIRDAITNPFWVIPGTSTFNYDVTADAATDFIFTPGSHVIRPGMVITFSTTGTLPGGLTAGTPYYAVQSTGSSARLKVSPTLGGTPVNLTSAGTGTITLVAQQGFQANASSDTFTSPDAHGLANGVKVRVSSYGQLPAGLLPNTDYYVIQTETRNFRLSLTLEGTPVSISSNGTGAHVLETQGSERRAGPSALTFAVNPDFAPATEGNDRVRVAIQQTGAEGDITSTLTGQGIVSDPYVYTLITTTTTNSNQAVINFVAADTVGAVKISTFLLVNNSPSTPSGLLFPFFTAFTDLGSFGLPTGVALTHGTYDNGSIELDWARNAGAPGTPAVTNDGFIMPNSSYSSSWNATSNTAVTGDLSIASLASTFSVRFANQVGSTVSLLNSGTYAIRTGGILVSPTVGPNDSTVSGNGRLTTENQGNLQNLMLHQYNPLGSLVVNNKITNRAAQVRTARLTGTSRRYLSMNVSLAGTQVAPDWSLPVTTSVNTGIAANTRVESFIQNRLIILGANHDGVLRNQVYAFASPGAIAVDADEPIAVGHPARNQITGLSTTANLAVGMTVQIVLANGLPGAGGGLTLDTTIAAILDDHTVLLNQPNDATFRVNTYSFSDGNTIINLPGVANDPNRFLITGMFDTVGLTPGMAVTGPGILPGTTVVETFTNPAYVRLSQMHDNVHRVAQTYTFGGSIQKTGTLPLVVVLPGSSSDPNRRIMDGVSSTAAISPGATVVAGNGIPANTTVELVLDNHTLYLSQYHDGAFRRTSYTFTGPQVVGGSTVVTATIPDADRRKVMGIQVPGAVSTVSTNDLYIGMPISGPGIPFGSTITFIYNESDIQVSTNHFFTAESTSLTFTPTTGIEKLGPGTVVLTGASDYTGVTFIGDGTLRANLLTDGGVPGSLGTSNGASANLVFNGGQLQYVGENSQTNRGFTVADFATLNVGHERTTATFSGAIASGLDRLNKSGPGTLELNGNANLAAMRLEQGRLLLQSVDLNPAPGTFTPANFSQSALTSLILGGGTLELRGAPEGNVTQNFGSQLTIEAGSTTLKVTSVPPNDPLALTSPFTRINLMGQEEITPVIRQPGGSVHFMENPQGNGAADIFLYLPIGQRGFILPWATYQDTTNVLNPGVNHFALVLKANTNSPTSGGDVVSAGSVIAYAIGPDYADPMKWSETRAAADLLDVSEGAFADDGSLLAINGPMTENRYVSTLRYASPVSGAMSIAAGQTLELVNGAILASTMVYNGQKAINGPGNITGGALNDVNSDFIMHNYNPTAPFTIGANIVDRTIKAASSSGVLGKGSVRTGEVQMLVNILGLPIDFFRRVRVGMQVTGPGIQAGTTVTAVELDFSRLLISLPATGDFDNQIYTFTDRVNFTQAGTGTTILSGNNTYTGNTYVHGGVLRLNSANAVPGGIAATGGTSAIIVEDGIIGLGTGDFTRRLGTGVSEIQFGGNGGFAAYGADRTVNLGGAVIPEVLRFGNNGFVPDGSSLILGSRDATHKLFFANPIDLSAFSQVIRVENSPIQVEAELSGSLSGLGRMIKFGLGTLRLGVSNNNQGGIEIAEGRLVAANVANVFGAASGAVRLGTSLTNTSSQAAVNLVVEGGTVANPLQVGSVNARGGAWTAGGLVENTQATANMGEEASAAIVSGYPAIAYYDATNQDLKYVRALDARGTAWGNPVTIASRGNVGRNPSLQIINGNPAVSYYDATAGMLMFVRSTDAQGVIWGTPLSVLGQSSPTAVAVQGDGKILVGGSFTRFDGQVRNRLVRLQAPAVSGGAFTLDPSFNANVMNGEVRALMVLPDGRILAGGSFTAVRDSGIATADTTRNRIAIFNSDGTLDTAVNPNANGDVRLFVRQTDGKIMVGGSFTTITGVTRTRMARLNVNLTLDTSFGNTDIRNGEVRSIIPEDSDPDVNGFESYAIAGTFTDIRGAARNRVARIMADAGLSGTFNPDANNTVLDMVRLPTGKFLVGGAFTAFTGGVIARTRLARLNNDGSVDETFGQEVNGEVRDLHLEANGDVLIAGVFSQLGDFSRTFIGRVLANGNVDTTFAPEPDNEVRQMTTMTDGKVVLVGSFNTVSGSTQQLAARILSTGAQDPEFTRNILNAGLYSSLYSVNGNPAIAYYNSVGGDIYYLRASDVNGATWPNPELIDATGDVGVGISLSVANVGGDLLTKDNRGTETVDDDEVTLSASVATVGVPVIAYGDATNSRIKYVVANNVNGAGNAGVGLGLPMSNWSTPLPVPNMEGDVGRHFTLGVVDGFPAIVYQTSDTLDLKYIRALNPAGITHNLRDPDTFEVQRILVSALIFSAATSWGTAVTLDGHASDNLGSFPSLALVNGQPTTAKNRPAVSYYDATRGDLKYVVSMDAAGAVWNAPVTLVSVNDVGRASTLMMADGLPAISYYNATSTDLEFVILNNASGYSLIAFNDNTTWTGNATLNGTVTLAPALGTLTQINGLISGAAGFRLAGGGTLRLGGHRDLVMTSVSGLQVGWRVAGPGIPADAIITAINVTTRTVTLDRDHDGIVRTDTFTFTHPSNTPVINVVGTVQGNNFATSLASPGLTTGPGRAVDGGAIIRSGTLLVDSSGALAGATVELGDQVSQQITVDRATNSLSVLNEGGSFNANHDGLTINLNGPGAFVAVGATIDGRYLGLTATTADPNLERFTGNLPNGTQILFRASIFPTGVEGGITYYVRGNSGGTFQVSLTPGGAAVNITESGTNVFFIEKASLDATFLVKDEDANPERNGVYRVVITPDNLEIAVNKINLARVAALDTVDEMLFGVRAIVSNGSSAGKTFYIGSTVIDRNVSALHWIQDSAASDVALLVNVSGVSLANAIDVNAVPGSVSTILGANSNVTTGNVVFSGPITLQNQALAAQDLETVRILSSTSTGLGVRFTGAISEVSSQDSLGLIKDGTGVVTLEGNSSFKGGIAINQGTLYVMNNTALAQAGQSGTGTGAVTLNAGTLLGGVGSIGGAVTTAGTAGSLAVIRPGDPFSASAPVETLTINAPLTVGADSVLEFTLGMTNMTRLAATSVDLSTPTSKILVQLDSGYNPAVGTEFQILDMDAPLKIFGTTALMNDLLTLLQLPLSKVWDLSTFITDGKIKVLGDPEPVVITDHPDDATRQQGQSVTFNIAYTGTAPIAFQWQKNSVPSPGAAVWVDIPGATGDALGLANLTQADEAQYRVRAINQVNAPAGIFSNAATLIVNWPLSFAKDLTPAARKASVGYPLTFKVIMNGEGPITYEWQKNGQPILGAPDADTYTIPSATTDDAGAYRVLVKGPFQTAGIMSAVSTVTVTNGPAVVLEEPESQTVLAGTNVNLSALPGGDNNTLVTSWKFGSAVIAGEFTNTLQLPGITLAQGGAYTFTVSNKVNATGKPSSAVSNPAYITVVENPNKIVAGQAGKSVKFTAVVKTDAKVKPAYLWRKNGGPLPGDTVGGKPRFAAVGNTLTINALVLTDSDTYTCEVTGAAGTAPVIGATHFVRVYNASPEIVKTTPPPAGMVGSYYSWKLPVSSDSAVPADWTKTPLTYAVAGLPAGLKLDAATGVISGRPTTPNKIVNNVEVPYTVTFTVTNAVKAAAGAATDATKWTTTMDINALPHGMAGVYAGPVERSATLNTSLGGRFDMTITTAGAYSGKLTLGVDAARPFAGAFTLNLNGAGDLVGAPAASVTIPGTKTSPPLTISFTLSITAPATPGDPPVTRLIPATIAYRTDSVNFAAWRNNFAAKAVPNVAKVPGDYLIVVPPVAPAIVPTYKPAIYNFAITLPSGDPLVTNVNVPQGAGYASFTVSTAGAYALAGRTADGESLTGSYWVGPEGEMFIFQALYAAVKTVPTKGSILGQLQIELNSLVTTDDNDLSGSLSWVRPPQPVASKARLYKAGFGLPGTPVTTPVNLVAFGGRFLAPAATATVLGALPTTTASLEFSENGDFLPDGADVATVTNPNQIDNITLAAGSKVTMASKVAPVNPALTALTVAHGTGILGGSFTLADPVVGIAKPVARKSSLMGLTIRVRTSGLGIEPRVTKTYGLGYFILEQLVGPPPAKQAETPQRSGMFSFED